LTHPILVDESHTCSKIIDELVTQRQPDKNWFEISEASMVQIIYSSSKIIRWTEWVQLTEINRNKVKREE
jgi:hypothetical protein